MILLIQTIIIYLVRDKYKIDFMVLGIKAIELPIGINIFFTAVGDIRVVKATLVAPLFPMCSSLSKM